MTYIIVGLGNPGEEYNATRHNVGRMVLEYFRKKHKLSEWESDKKKNALVSGGNLVREKLLLIEPETFMNNSGKSIRAVVKSEKQAEKLIVVYDDIDLPFGMIKVSFNKGAGGHRGIESIVKHIKTRKFIRVRIGISPTTPSGKMRKPQGEQKVLDFIMGSFKPKELEVIKKVSKNAALAIESVVSEGKTIAMNKFN